MPSSWRKPATFAPPDQPSAYCPRAVVRSSRRGTVMDFSTLSFSARRFVGVEGDRLLHRDQRHQLEQVVLDHVARRADAVVVAGAAADADVLGHRDLHVVDEVGVPERLEHLVGEPHRQDVLHRLLAEVVVDPEDRLGRERVAERGLQLARRLEVVTERLLHHDPTPRPGLRVDHPVLLELLHDVAEQARAGWPGRTRGCRPCRARCRARRGCGQVAERDVVVELTRHEPEALGELLPDLLTELGAGVLLHRVVHDRREVLVGPVAPGEADQAEPRRQQPAVGQVVDRRHHLLARQVAGDAEQHQPARPGDARQPAVLGIAEGVGPASGLARRAHCSAWRTASRSAGLARCSRSTGRPFSASTCPSPTACAIRNSWKVNGRSGTARSRSGWLVTWR